MPSRTLSRVYQLATRVSPRCSPFSFFFSSFTSSLSPPPPPHTPVDEQSVLDQLSDLLPIYRPFHPEYSADKPSAEERRVDAFLTPAEKLRGVFLQKPKGRAAVEAALSGVGIEPSAEILAEVLDRGNLGGEAMVSFFDWAVKLPGFGKEVGVFRVVLKALGRRKFFDHMELVLERMREDGMELDLEIVRIVVDSYVKARRIRKAIGFLLKLGEFGLDCKKVECLNVLLRCLCSRGHVGAADCLFARIKGEIEINRDSYEIVVSGWAGVGKVIEMERTLEAMAAEGFEPSCSTYSYLIEGLGRAGRLNESIEVFNQMETHLGCSPDTAAFVALIFNFVGARDLDEAWKFYKLMLQGGLVPDVDTYFKLINSYIKVRRVADALEMFEEMLQKGVVPTTGAITSCLEPLCRFGPPYAATMIYQKARKLGCKISLKAYNLLMMRLSRFGKCGMLLKIWEEMQEDGYSSNVEVYEYIINGFCNIGQLENAVFALEDGLKKGYCPGKIIYSKLNNKLLSANKTEVAYKLFLKVKKARLLQNARRYWRANGWHF